MCKAFEVFHAFVMHSSEGHDSQNNDVLWGPMGYYGRRENSEGKRWWDEHLAPLYPGFSKVNSGRKAGNSEINKLVEVMFQKKLKLLHKS